MPFSHRLSSDELARCKKEAQKEGIFAGITGGFVSALLASTLHLGRNKMLFTGLLTGSLSGYFFTQAFFSSHVARAEAQNLLLRAQNPTTASNDLSQPPSPQRPT